MIDPWLVYTRDPPEEQQSHGLKKTMKRSRSLQAESSGGTKIRSLGQELSEETYACKRKVTETTATGTLKFIIQLYALYSSTFNFLSVRLILPRVLPTLG